MSETTDLIVVMNEDGQFEEYDDAYDITIHCTSQEEYDSVVARLNAATEETSIRKNVKYLLDKYTHEIEKLEEDLANDEIGGIRQYRAGRRSALLCVVDDLTELLGGEQND